MMIHRTPDYPIDPIFLNLLPVALQAREELSQRLALHEIAFGGAFPQ